MQRQKREEAGPVWEGAIYPVQEQVIQWSVVVVVVGNRRLEAPGKKGWRTHILWWLQSQRVCGEEFSVKGDTGSDPHSRKFTSGQPGMDWEARWLRGQLRGHCFAILTIVTLGSGCAWNCPSYSTNWFAEPASFSCALHYAEAGASGNFPLSTP